LLTIGAVSEVIADSIPVTKKGIFDCTLPAVIALWRFDGITQLLQACLQLIWLQFIVLLLLSICLGCVTAGCTLLLL
jgi:hypothetical protein